MPLAIDYRPTTFEEVVGNGPIIAQLRALTAKDDPPHAYLLTGPTGCGKTTLAHIIAGALGYQSFDYRQHDAAYYGGVPRHVLNDNTKVPEHEVATAILKQFLKPAHNNGLAGLTLACRMVVRDGHDT